MALSTALYHRFIKGQCTEAEEEEVLLYFRTHPEAMEEYLEYHDWETFEPEGKLHPVVSEKVLQKVHHSIHARSQMFKTIRRIAIAAILTGSAVMVWRLATPNKPARSIALQHIITPITPEYQQHENNGPTILSLILEDGSAVLLHPKSKILYHPNFDANKREIWLNGTARFEVAQDSKRPLTVYAASIGTTALGTAFLVKENAVTKSVTVKLYNGKVIVHQQSQPGQPVFAARYLSPGDKLVYKPGTANPVIVNENVTNSDKTMPATGTDNATASSLLYHNKPLPEVLQTLEQHFSTDINYNKKALSKIRVTAEFNYNDSLEQILEVIATLNNLQLTHTEKGFSLTK
jgi:transmembrane sensor